MYKLILLFAIANAYELMFVDDLDDFYVGDKLIHTNVMVEIENNTMKDVRIELSVVSFTYTYSDIILFAMYSAIIIVPMLLYIRKLKIKNE